MKKHFMITSGAACLAALLNVSTVAADQVAATGALAEVSTAAVIAKANLAGAAGSGDVNAIAEAKKRADAVDAAVAEAQDAYNAMERALQSGDAAAANSAEDALNSAVAKANNANNGMFSNEAPKAVVQKKAKDSDEPVEANDPPNIYANASDTATKQAVMQGAFGNFWSTSAFGTRTGFGDREATPE